ncbi:MAG: DNA repair protein RadA [Lachnospiraceae bacterium]|nr:DNA repair protein RadA [Lachnospiraceae bacterium]
MAKGKDTVFFCNNCGHESSKWMGQCPGCKEWNTFVEEKKINVGNKSSLLSGKIVSRPMQINDISVEAEDRISTNIGELDRVLGGGLMAGSLTLVGGDPGIGKSTLLLQVCRNLSLANQKVLYISGEESLKQIKLRADRIGSFDENMLLLCDTSLANIAENIKETKPAIVVIDSIQTMYDEEISSAPGSVSQVRQATSVFLELAKGMGISIFIVGHVTKEGTVAGPRVLEHMVDTVLYFEGDRHASYRVLRGVKNRFGSTNEIGVFRMDNDGLKEVTNPSEYMLSGKPEDAAGSVVVCSLEGTRPMLVEIQALVSTSGFGIPRRQAIGTDLNKVNLLIAVLEKRLGLQMTNCDAYVNIAGGLKISEPGIDMGIALSIISSFKNKVIPDDIVCVGEIGLSGEVRAVSMINERVNEALKLGFKCCIVPKVCESQIKIKKDIKLIFVSNISDIMSLDF